MRWAVYEKLQRLSYSASEDKINKIDSMLGSSLYFSLIWLQEHDIGLELFLEHSGYKFFLWVSLYFYKLTNSGLVIPSSGTCFQELSQIDFSSTYILGNETSNILFIIIWKTPGLAWTMEYSYSIIQVIRGQCLRIVAHMIRWGGIQRAFIPI